MATHTAAARAFGRAVIAAACILFAVGEAALAQQLGPTIARVTSDAPPAGFAFALHRSVAGPPHVTAPEPIHITNAQNPTAAWTATTTEPWLVISPTSGTSPSTATISIDPSLLVSFSVGSFVGAVQIVSPIAPQDVLTINVSLRITDFNSTTEGPIGLLETPPQNAIGLSGAVAVTGWTVDDVGIRRVQIYRDPVGAEPPGLVFVGDATRVRGARPDIVAAVPGRPEVAIAGWGLMVLSNMLPDQNTGGSSGGNGTFIFSAIAEDIEGHRVVLGQRTLTFDNQNSTKPFGTIDQPQQGGTMSGTFANQGWILAQPMRFIPTDGSTIRLIVDGTVRPDVAMYGFPRPDVRALFPWPQYFNADGPAAQFLIDTTQFANGPHTIVWVVTDNLGVSQGIGSRHVTIENPSGSGVSASEPQARSAASVNAIPPSAAFVWDRKGLDEGPWSVQFAGEQASEIRQAPGERLEIALDTWWFSRGCGPYEGYVLKGDVAAPLPAGASIDGEQGLFRWLPPVEFAGTFDFVFIRRACTGREERISLRVVIGPQGN